MCRDFVVVQACVEKTREARGELDSVPAAAVVVILATNRKMGGRLECGDVFLDEEDPVMVAWRNSVGGAGVVGDAFGGGETPRATLPGPHGGDGVHAVIPPPSSAGSSGRRGEMRVVYDVDNAVQALDMLLDGLKGDADQGSVLSLKEASGIVTMLKKYVRHADGQRKMMIEREASVTTELRHMEHEVKAAKEAADRAKAGLIEQKKLVRRLKDDKEAIASENRSMQASLEYTRQKEKVAVEACQKASAHVEEIKRRAARKIEGAEKRLQELEVQMHLAGYPGARRALQDACPSQADSDDTIDDVIESLGRRAEAIEPRALEPLNANNSAAMSGKENSASGDAPKVFKSELATMQRRVRRMIVCASVCCMLYNSKTTSSWMIDDIFLLISAG